MKILIIDEKKTRREELASINKEVNNILKNCDQLHILTGNECTSFIEEIRSNKETSHIAKYAIIYNPQNEMFVRFGTKRS